jgi:hypothetical protein
VLERVSRARNSSERAVQDETPTKMMSKRSKSRDGLSNRLELYKKYDATQIQKISELWVTLRHRLLYADKNLSIPISYTDGTPTEYIPITPEDRDRLFKKLFHLDLEGLKLESLHPTFDEAVIAALETGEIHGDELDAVLTIDDLWNPEVSFWEKASRFAKKYAGPALVLVPSPISFWASLILTLGDAYVNKKFKRPADADDRGISLF